MNLPQLAQQTNPTPYLPHSLNLPGAVHVHRAAAGMFDGDLYLSLVTDAGAVTTLLFEAEDIETLRAALKVEPVEAKVACRTALVVLAKYLDTAVTA